MPRAHNVPPIISASKRTSRDLESRRRYNSRLPVSKLFPDLLEPLFILASIDPDEQWASLTALSISQVCHSWRFIALSLPILWANLVDFEERSKSWNIEMLRRSDTYPIDLSRRDFVPRAENIISKELDHLARLRTYRVMFDSTSQETLIDKLSNEAPQLVHLDLSYIGTSAGGRLEFPSSLLGDDAPLLRQLELTRCTLDLTSPVLINLSTLSIRNVNMAMAPTLSQWIGALRRMPGLTTLSIQDSFAPLPQSLFHPSPSKSSVELPCLSELYLDGHISNVALLLRDLAFPMNCGMMLSCTEVVPGPLFEIVRDAFSQRINHAQPLNHHNIYSLFIYAKGTSLSISNEPNEYETTGRLPKGPNPYLYLDLHSASNPNGWAELLPPLLSAMDDTFSKVSSLELQLPAIPPALMSSLSKATRLTTLMNLSGAMSKKLLAVLQKPYPLPLNGGIEIVPIFLLPALHTILFTEDSSMWGPAYRVFQSFLRWRRNGDAPLKRIVFRKCSVLRDTMERLEWDGVEVDYDPQGVRWQTM
jgi:hypothetical protein